MREVSPGVVSRWLLALDVQPKLARTVLSQVMDLAVLDDAIGVNPVRLVPRLTDRDATPRRPRALRPAELLAVRDAIGAWGASAPQWLPLRAAVLLEPVTGTRIGEASRFDGATSTWTAASSMSTVPWSRSKVSG